MELSHETNLSTDRQSVAEGAIDVLFAPGERWGWEWRDVNQFYSPYSTPPPASPHSVPQQRDDPIAVYSRWKWQVWLWGLAIFLVPGIVLLPLDAASEDAYGLLLLLSWVVGYVWLFQRTKDLRRRAREAAQAGETPWQAQWREMSSQHEAAKAEWQRRANEYDAEERRRLAQLPEWGAVRPTMPSRRIDVYGGTVPGWQALTTTLGASLLGSGQNLFVLDFSEADVAALLFHAAREAGLPTRAHVLPEELERLDVFAGLEPMAIKETLVEALHADRSDGDRTARSVDDRILTAVCEVLAPNVTLERVHLALRVLLRDEPQPPDNGAPLSNGEWNRISELFNVEYRNVIATPLVHLDSQLAPLRSLGRAGTFSAAGDGARCEGVAISRGGASLLNELLVDILVQTTIRQLRDRSGRQASRVLVVIAADLLKKRHLERMDDLAASLGTRVVYLFRHLREDVLDVAGGSGAVAAVMRPGGHQEAEQAANFIGREHRFELAQTTYTGGIADTLSWADTDSVSKTMSMEHFARTDTTGTTRGGSKTTSEQEATTRQRVHEYVMEPEVLRALPPTALVLVEFSPGPGQHHVRLADCNPALASLPRASPRPFSERPAEVAAGG